MRGSDFAVAAGVVLAIVAVVYVVWRPEPSTNAVPTTSPSAPRTTASTSSGSADYDAAVQLETREDYEHAEPRFAAACAAGHRRACVRQAGYHVLGLAPFKRDLPRAAALLRSACTADGWLACAYENTLCALEPAPCGPPAMKSFSPEKWDDVRHACEADTMDACLLLGAKAMDDEDYAGAAPQFRRACEKGELDGCGLHIQARVLPGPRPDPNDTVPVLPIGCKGGDGECCADLAMMVGTDDMMRRTRNKDAEALWALACGAQPTGFYLGSVASLARPPVAMGCLVLSWVLEAHPENRSEAERAKTLARKACRLGALDDCPPGERR